MQLGNMSKIVNGKRYSAKTATVIASNEYWDGHNNVRNGRNTYLLRTPNGNYFTAMVSMWEDERSGLEPLSEDEAIGLYEELPEHECEYEDAFPDKKIEEA